MKTFTTDPAIPKDRTSRLLGVAAILSLILAFWFSLGYLGRIGVQLNDNRTRGYLILMIALSRGRFEIVAERPGDLSPGTWQPSHFTVSPLLHLWPLEMPDIKRSIFELDAHPLTFIKPRWVIFAFPIWCLCLPCLIAPTMWLRKRRRPMPHGFEVTEVPAF